MLIASICTPAATTTIAANICPNNFCNGLRVFTSSNIPVTVIIIVPTNIPSNF